METIVARAARTAIPHFVFFLILLLAGGPARAQQPVGGMVGLNNPTDVLKAMDQEQNRKLEQQKQQLMNQIINVRQALVACPKPAHVTLAKNSDPPAMTKAPDTQTVQALVNHTDSAPQSASRPGQARSTRAATTDTYLQPETWDEWNPGPGFKLARTEKGELNLSVDVYHSPVTNTFGFLCGTTHGPDR